MPGNEFIYGVSSIDGVTITPLRVNPFTNTVDLGELPQPLIFTNSDNGRGSYINNGGLVPFTKTVNSGEVLHLIDLNFHNTQSVNQNGAFDGIYITTDSDAVDVSAGVNIDNRGGSDALHIRVTGKQSLGSNNTPTGIGIDYNKGTGTSEGSSNNLGYAIQSWDWSTTDTGLQTPTQLFLAKHLNLDTNHTLARLEGNRNSLRFVVPQGGLYTGVEPLVDLLGGGSFSQRFVINAAGQLSQGPNSPLLGIESSTKNGIRSTGTNVSMYLDSVVSGEGRLISQDGSLGSNGRVITFVTLTGLVETARFTNTSLFGLGINNPIYKADIYGATRIQGGLYIDTISTPTTPVITSKGTISSTTLNTGGSGYLVNDILSISGGTGGQITVNTVDGSGAILTYTLSAAGGGYVVTTGSIMTLVRGTGATFNTIIVVGGVLATVTLNNSGSNYIVGDILLVGGGINGQITVNTVDGSGAILTYTLTKTGSGYVATTGATTTLTTGGTGGKINIVSVATGATTYGYKITAVNPLGETIGSTEGTTTTGNATLDSNNFNRIAWTAGTSGTIVSKYNIYRTTSGGTPSSTGLIGSATAPTLAFNDTGLSASGSVPIINNTGNVGIGISSPTASLHLRSGTASPNTAPLQFQGGTNETIPRAGLIEYNGNFYATQGGTVRFSIGGTLFDHYTDVGNTHTDGATYDDLYTDTLVANTFNTNGDKVTSRYSGIFVSSATATREIKVLFAGTTILDTGSLTTATADSWDISAMLIRVSSTVVRCIATIVASTAAGGNVFNNTIYTEITSLTLSSTNILKVTGVSGGTGAAANDIVAKFGSVIFEPAA